MKVLIATPYFHPQTGGLETYARQIALGLHARGWEVVIVCGATQVNAVTKTTEDGLTIYRLPIWKVFSNTPVNLAWYGQLRRILQAERPDVINTHMPVPFMADMVTLAAGRIPVAITYHAATLDKPGSLLMKIVTSTYELAQKFTFARAKAIIAVSPYVKTALGTHYAPKTHIVFNAVPAVAPARTTAGSGLVFVANLLPTHAWKGLDLLLEALAIARDQYGLTPPLTIIGDGSDRPRYEQKVEDLGLTNVHFAGRQVGEERDQLVRAAAAMILYPTTANDAFPTVLLEAWALGLPVIAAHIGPLPSLIETGRTGLLAEAKNPAALAAAIKDLLADPAAARTMGEAGRWLVAEHYTWPTQVEATANLLEDLA